MMIKRNFIYKLQEYKHRYTYYFQKVSSKSPKIIIRDRNWYWAKICTTLKVQPLHWRADCLHHTSHYIVSGRRRINDEIQPNIFLTKHLIRNANYCFSEICLPLYHTYYSTSTFDKDYYIRTSYLWAATKVVFWQHLHVSIFKPIMQLHSGNKTIVHWMANETRKYWLSTPFLQCSQPVFSVMYSEILIEF